MARIQLDIPAELPFSCKLRVRITDLNYGGHLGNDKILTLMHEARALFFVHYGYTEMSAEGASFIMGDCGIVFKSEGHFNQDLICEVGVGEYTRVAMDMYYRLRDAESGKVVAEGKTSLINFDYDRGKVRSLPSQLRERLGDASAVPQNEKSA